MAFAMGLAGRPNDRHAGHDLFCCDHGKSWMPACAGMTGAQRRRGVDAAPVGQSFRRLT
jgi:hypothetical protein